MEWQIRWNDARWSYLYGSMIKIDSNTVEFKNNLIPPATIINKWSSHTNHQIDRIEPGLPLLYDNDDYFMDVDIESDGRFLIKIIFYDLYDHEIDTCILQNGKGAFKTPINMYYYHVQLISAGCHHLVYKKMRIIYEEK